MLNVGDLVVCGINTTPPGTYYGKIREITPYFVVCNSWYSFTPKKHLLRYAFGGPMSKLSCREPTEEEREMWNKRLPQIILWKV